MSDPRDELIEEVFHEALDRGTESREAFLVERCASDTDLLARVRELLAHDDLAGDSFLGGGAGGPDPPAPVEHSDDGTAAVPRVLDRYQIVRLLGEGGMGRVYEARQDHPRRSVALKLLRGDCADRSALRRFQLEAEALGQLQHPGIAQVYEAGTLESEGPDGSRRRLSFLAMEFIRGVPLDVFVRERRLPPHDTLAIVAKIAEAVGHAHLRGVIHRDLKPGNILVDDAADPKVLDFGIARLVRADVGNVTTATLAGQLIGTLPYMSPEQVSGEHDAVDARTDVYSLGVVMYEILSGRLPLDVRGGSVTDAAQVIRETDPPRLGLVCPTLRGDVETIVAKAMEKDRHQRYQSASELAADIRRFLSHEPVLARPPSSLYHLRKFARRNKALVAGVAAALAATTLGSIGMTYLAHRESLQRALAEENARRSRLLAYRSSVVAAQAALDMQDAGLARDLLDASPPELRDWEWRHLDWTISRFDRSFSHPGGANCAAPAPDGSRIFVGGRDGSLCVFDGRTGELEARWHLSQSPIKSLALRHDVARVIVSHGAGVVAIDGLGGRRLWSVDAHGAGVDAGGISPDGTVVAVRIPGEYGVEIRDVETGAQRARLPIDDPDALVARFSPDGRHIVVRVGQTLELRDWESGASVWTTPGCWCQGFSPDGTRIAVLPCAEGAGVRLVDGDTGDPLPRESFEDVRSIALSDGIGFDVTGDSDGGLSVRDPLSGRALARAPSEGLGPVLLDGGKRVLSVSSAGDVRLWSLATLVAPLQVMSQFLSTTYVVSGDGRCAVSGEWEHLRGWDLETGRQIWSRRFPRQPLPEPSISDDGARVGVDLGDELQILDGTAGATLHVLALPPEAKRRPNVWSPDGTTLLRGGHDGSLFAIDADQGRIRTSHRIAAEPVAPLACAPAGDAVLVAIGNREIAMVRSLDGIAAWRASDRDADATCAAFSPDETLVAIGDEAGSVELREARTGRLSARLVGDRVAMQALSFHPGGSRLAAASDNGIILLDPRDAAEVLRLRFFRGVDLSGSAASRAVFSRDGSRLCVARGRFGSFETETDPQRFALRLRACEAQRIVQESTPPLAVASDVCAALMARTDLAPQRRNDALAWVRARGDHINRLNSDAWEVVLRDDEPIETYRHALRASLRACEAQPDDAAFLNTLGLAQCRSGEHQAAIETMRRCDELHRARGSGSHAGPQGDHSQPIDLVVLAMALHGAGRVDEARAARSAASEILGDPTRSSDADRDARILLTELDRRWPVP